MNPKKITLTLLFTLLLPTQLKSESFTDAAEIIGSAMGSLVVGYVVLYRYIAPRMADLSISKDSQVLLDMVKKAHQENMFLQRKIEIITRPVIQEALSLQEEISKPGISDDERKILEEKIHIIGKKLEPFGEKLQNLLEEQKSNQEKLTELEEEKPRLINAYTDILCKSFSSMIPLISLDNNGQHHE